MILRIIFVVVLFLLCLLDGICYDIFHSLDYFHAEAVFDEDFRVADERGLDPTVGGNAVYRDEFESWCFADACVGYRRLPAILRFRVFRLILFLFLNLSLGLASDQRSCTIVERCVERHNRIRGRLNSNQVAALRAVRLSKIELEHLFAFCVKHYQALL